MNRKPSRRSCTISSITASEARWRGRCPSIRHTEKNEQCLGTPAHRLDGSPHVPLPRNQVPTSGNEIGRFDASCFVDRLQGATATVVNGLRPGEITVAFYDGMRPAELVCLLWIQGCVNAAENHKCSAVTRDCADPVSSQRVCRMHANTDNITWLDGRGIESRQGLIDQPGIAETFRRCAREYIHPTGSDNGGPKRDVPP